ncbi:type II toxin-antitoxin system RelE/ParE family toxin [Alcaligenaceae bacterium]|nr:type II toxin-antitoxin system RelE/ParE family toxin [Alcaligenaceae bacterium]
MSRTLHLTESAEADLSEIWSYIAEEASEKTAQHFISKLQETCRKVLSFPEGQPARPLIASNLRVTFHGAYAIYYTYTEDTVYSVRVLHGARDISRIMAKGGFS